MTFYVHMYGRDIGRLNIYQAPVIGHDIVKEAFTKSQGNAWVKEEVIFDSDKEFQIILEGVRGTNYKGDIALDDISLGPGCQRLGIPTTFAYNSFSSIKPAYVRLRSQNASQFDQGRVEVYYNESWGQVCNRGWTGADSNVTCKELGFQAAVQNFAGTPMDNQEMSGFQSINCKGSEKSIHQCPKSVWSNSTSCPNNQTASLQCTVIAAVCPLKTHFYCPQNELNESAKCISVAQRCDFTKDCWDGSDETNCDNYTRCTFEDPNICDWLQAKNDHMNWTRHRGSTPSLYTGPDKDHNGDSSKYYIYINVAGRSRSDKAKIAATPRFQGDHEGLCKVRFFYHMYGWATGSLRVLISDIYTTRTVWRKYGPHGNTWIRAEVTLLNTSRSFQVIFEAEHSGRYQTGDIAIDDVSFTPECRPAKHENVTCKDGTFKCLSGECIALENRCDFKMDCFDGFDELNCGFELPGRCNFERDFCDWTNETEDDNFDFERAKGATMSYGTGPTYDHTLGYGNNGYYAYIEGSVPRVRGDKARLAGPQFMWKGIVGCKMHFFYHMWSRQSRYFVGTLKALLRNVITGETKTLWQRTGSQGMRWILADVPIATNWSVSQVILEATRGYSFQSDIAIDDISFSPLCYSSIPAHVDKNYDVRLVGKKSSYQGRVEVFRVGLWGTVCSDGWDKQDANVVCRQLGYTGAIERVINTLPGKGQIWLDNLKCFGNENDDDDSGSCDDDDDSGGCIDDDDDDDSGSCGDDDDDSGGCIDDDDDSDGCIDDDNDDDSGGCIDDDDDSGGCIDDDDDDDSGSCGDDDDDIGGCIDDDDDDDSGSCGDDDDDSGGCIDDDNDDDSGGCGDDVVVIKMTMRWNSFTLFVPTIFYDDCGIMVLVWLAGGPTVPLRLTGYQNDTQRGLVEVYRQGIWGTVCFDEWDLHDAHVVCRQTGFLGIERVTKEKKERSASEGNIRLNGGRSPKEGRVEIFHRGEWGSVCEDKWSQEDAKVVCFELGFTSVISHYQSFGPGSGRVWLNNVECRGNESTLTSCRRSYWGRNPCTHDEDVGVICGDNAYIGCFKDNEPRVMPHKMSMKDLTPVKCLRYCQSKGYSYIGLEWSTECYCGNHYDKYGNASSGDCASPCVGDLTKTCGGPWRLSVYAANPAILPSSAPGYLPIRQSCSSVTYLGNYAILNPVRSPNYFSGDHNTGFIWSPKFPANYPNKIHCVWVLNLLHGSKAHVQFEAFSLEDLYDTFEARDGKRRYNSRLTPYFGFSGNDSKSLTASSNTMWLKFYADETINAKGFKLRYDATGLKMSTTPGPTFGTTTINPSSLPFIQKIIGGCNGVLHAVNITFGYYDHNHNTGYIKSPDNPGQYGNNLKCNWTIVVQSGFKISVKVKQLELGSFGDLLSIGDGYTTQNSRDHPLPWSFQSRDRFMRVFFSDKSGRRRKRSFATGFLLNYERDFVNVTKASSSIFSTAVLTSSFRISSVFPLHTSSLIPASSVHGLTSSISTAIQPTNVNKYIGRQDNIYNNHKHKPIIYRTTFVPTMAHTTTDNKQKRSSNLSGGSIAGIVIGFIVLILVILILVYFLIKNKKKRNNQGARHCFVNQAYENTEGMVMSNPAIGAAPPGHTDQSIFYANVAVAPPPYTPQAENSDPVPGYAVPSAPENQYANLYACPPAYRQSGGDRNATTTTSIGSVTSLRDAAQNDSPLPGIGVQVVLPKSGPLPEKVPLDALTANNNNTEPPTRHNPTGPLEGHVTRIQSSIAFDVEVPFEFICPISNDIMNHPVSASDGYTYERRAIKSWFRRNQSSPMTNEKLTDLNLRSNEHLETRIKEFVQAHSKA
ncbi:hypothetical protein QZH41_010040 [Actinostola sp. cb2023]|nr:hypothetical protein QZH41_010040 [Actinostola sp. cb2023]